MSRRKELDANAMREVAAEAHDRLAREVIQLLLETGTSALSRREKADIKREIAMRERWMDLLCKVRDAETSMDADTGVDGLFIAGPRALASKEAG